MKDKRGFIDKMLKLFPSPEDDYWTRRYTFGGKTRRIPRRLVGHDRVALILINVAAPFALARAVSHNNIKEECAARKLYCSMPRQENNSVVKFMKERLCQTMNSIPFVETRKSSPGFEGDGGAFTSGAFVNIRFNGMTIKVSGEVRPIFRSPFAPILLKAISEFAKDVKAEFEFIAFRSGFVNIFSSGEELSYFAYFGYKENTLAPIFPTEDIA